ncbi:MAG: S41 family peptidase [Candidatus Altimarinota bacterium]
MKTNKTLIFTSILAIFSFSGLAQAAQINDLSPNSPQYMAIQNLVDSGAFSLDDQDNFRPDQPINQVSFLKAALSYSGFKPKPTLNFFTGYIDVPEESWFAPYVKRALEIRLITNNLNTYYLPDRSINRQEGLLMAMQLFGVPTPYSEPTSDQLFDDIRTNSQFSFIYKIAKDLNINFSADPDSFHPARVLTRADAAELLYKSNLVGQAYLENPQVGPTISVAPQYGEHDADLYKNEQFSIFLDAWNKINSSYIYTDQVNSKELLYGAISGMVETLEDPYSTFNKPGENGQEVIYILEEYEGIGAVIEKIDQDFIIQTTLNNSPAFRAGLQTGDIIQEINGKNVTNMTLDQAFDEIQGAAGTKISLRIKRGTQSLTFSMTREKINIDSVHLSTAAPGINIIRIDQFTKQSSDEFATAIEEIEKSGSKKLIVDLRNNPGGYLSSTQLIMNYFLDFDQIEFYTENNDGSQVPYFSTGSGQLKDYKVVVLINQGSASAAEIMAGALQDYDLAHLIGTQSFGKGSVQEISEYTDNSSLKLTIAKWLTPKKNSIDQTGVTPDQIVEITQAQKASGQDPQLDAAIQYLK